MTHRSPDINTTPLIDVLLVLLVLLILTIPRATHTVSLNLPGVRTSKLAPPPVARLEVDFDGQVYWNGEAVADGRLEQRFRDSDAAIVVHVEPDRHVRYERVAQVLASAQRAHVSRLTLAPVTD